MSTRSEARIFRAESKVRLALLAASALTLAAGSANADIKTFDYDGGLSTAYLGSGNFSGSHSLPSGPKASASLGLSFDGVSQLDSAIVNGGGISVPPDTMGAIGATQFFETSNSAFAVYDKATGTRTLLESGDTFWSNVGQPGFGGDSRVRFDAPTQRWIVTSLNGGNDSNVHIAISDTSDALGSWKSVSLNAYPPGIADYPTLAIDNNAVYIGTDNYALVGGGYNFTGTSLFVVPKGDLFTAGAPTLANLARFDNPYFNGTPDRGFAIQGLNSTAAGTTGGVVASSLYTNQLTRYDILNAGTAGATQTTPVNGIGPNDNSPVPAAQPNGTQVVDALDARVSSSAWLQNGKVYTVFTIQDATGHDAVRYEVLNATTNVVIDAGTISGGGYDYYQGSLAVNGSGQVVIGYNRSGFAAGSGNISVFERSFNSTASGALVQTSEQLLHQSAVDNYTTTDPFGVERWGDYSAVTLDPNNPESFWVIGEYANQPFSNGWSQWGTWISDVVLAPVGTAVPEPGTWAMMLLGFGLVGVATRRRARAALSAV